MPPNTRYQISRVVTPASSVALITLAQAKAVLGIAPGDTSQDAAVSAHIAAITAAINNYCARTFVRQGYSDQFRYVHNWLGAGQPIVTRQWPIALDVDGPVVNISEDGAAVAATAWEVDTEAGALYRLNGAAVGCWTGTLIVVDYDAGYDTVPADVQGAAIEWLAARWSATARDPTLRSETIPDLITQVYSDTSTTTSTAMPNGVRDWLAPYRRWYV